MILIFANDFLLLYLINSHMMGKKFVLSLICIPLLGLYFHCERWDSSPLGKVTINLHATDQELQFC